jgi:hypothetical protein
MRTVSLSLLRKPPLPGGGKPLLQYKYPWSLCPHLRQNFLRIKYSPSLNPFKRWMSLRCRRQTLCPHPFASEVKVYLQMWTPHLPRNNRTQYAWTVGKTLASALPLLETSYGLSGSYVQRHPLLRVHYYHGFVAGRQNAHAPLHLRNLDLFPCYAPRPFLSFPPPMLPPPQPMQPMSGLSQRKHGAPWTSPLELLWVNPLSKTPLLLCSTTFS